jgi:hypothetical protein
VCNCNVGQSQPVNNCRTCRTGTPARRQRSDGQECPSYSRFATVVSGLLILGDARDPLPAASASDLSQTDFFALDYASCVERIEKAGSESLLPSQTFRLLLTRQKSGLTTIGRFR